MTTPAERLCSRWWRLRNSTWMIPVVLLAGLGTWGGFLYIGSKSKNRAWTRAALVYAVVVVPLFVAGTLVDDGQKDVSTTAERLVSLPSLILWIVGIVHAVRVNKQWLAWKAQADSFSPTWPSQPMAAGVALPPPPPPASAYGLGVGQSPVPTPSSLHHSAMSGAGAVLDVNTATMQQLVGELGLSSDEAIRVLEVRARLGRFSSIDQLVTDVGLQPHIFARLRSRIAVTPSSMPAPKPARRLDL